MVRKMGLCLLTNAYFVAPECETVLRIIKDFQRTLCSMTGFLTVVKYALDFICSSLAVLPSTQLRWANKLNVPRSLFLLGWFSWTEAELTDCRRAKNCTAAPCISPELSLFCYSVFSIMWKIWTLLCQPTRWHIVKDLLWISFTKETMVMQPCQIALHSTGVSLYMRLSLKCFSTWDAPLKLEKTRTNERKITGCVWAKCLICQFPVLLP